MAHCSILMGQLLQLIPRHVFDHLADRLGWKGLVRQAPPPLPARMRELVSLLYKSCCDGITGKSFFGAPPLEDILSELGKTL